MIGGEPGIGKSTLLLQAGALASQKGKKILYISGEESLSQIKLRAERLKLSSSSLSVLCEVSLERIKKFIEEISPDWIILDSIQAVYKPDY